MASWRSSSTARCAWPTPGSAFPRKRGAAAAPTAASARKPAACPTRCWWTAHAPLGDARYLLSPGDLYTLRQIPEIVEIGLSALKIEGRYKDAEYVALTTRAYRQAVDEAWAGRPSAASPATELQLEQVYSRGLGPLVPHRNRSPGGGEGPRAAPSRRADGAGGAGDLRRRRDRTGRCARPGPAEARRRGGVRRRRLAQSRRARGRRPRVPGGARATAMHSSAFRQRRHRLQPHPPRETCCGARTIPISAKAARPYLEPAAPLRRQPVGVRVVAREGAPLETEWTVAGRAGHRALGGARSVGARRTGPLRRSTWRRISAVGQHAYDLAGLEAEIAGRLSPPAPC